VPDLIRSQEAIQQQGRKSLISNHLRFEDHQQINGSIISQIWQGISQLDQVI
jgi:hypothetical protein